MSKSELTRCRRALEYALGVPFVDGNILKPLHNGEQIFPAMHKAIAAAQHRIDFVTFVYWQGRIAEEFATALADAASRGVKVRVLLDSYGCKSMEKRNLEQLAKSNVEVRWFRPLKTLRLWRIDKRTHRKILVCDDAVAFTGGVGIADEWCGDARNAGEWRDTHLRIEGPAAIGLRSAFIDNWNEAGDWEWDSPLDSGDPDANGDPVQVIRAASTVGWTDMAAVVRSLIAVASERVRLVTAYFSPDPATLQQMLKACEEGLKLELLIPGQHTDSRLSQLAGNPAVEQLLEAGAAVWRYEKTMLHAKVAIVDDLVCCIGSPNLNHRSMGKDEECCVIILSRSLAADLNNRFESDCADARALTLESWRERSRLTRVAEKIARLGIEQL